MVSSKAQLAAAICMELERIEPQLMRMRIPDFDMSRFILDLKTFMNEASRRRANVH